jgi:hypothetical protein
VERRAWQALRAAANGRCSGFLSGVGVRDSSRRSQRPVLVSSRAAGDWGKKAAVAARWASRSAGAGWC